MLVDGEINGRRRKLVVTASRNGYYFTLDRTTGERLVTSQFSETANWASGLNAKGQPVRIPEKDHHVGGALVSSNNSGATNWPPQAFSPDTGLLYVPLAENYAMYYLTELDPRGAMGLGGKDEISVGGRRQLHPGHRLQDRQDGVEASIQGGDRWPPQPWPADDGRPAALRGDVSGISSRSMQRGRPLWHARIGNVSNAPQTYLVDGRQHVLVAAGDRLYSFALYQSG